MATTIKAENIVQSIVALGNILSPLFKSNDAMCLLKEEINYLDNYIKIMNWRYGNVIKFNVYAEEKITHYRVPRFILQPLVENSIVHGMKETQFLMDIDINFFEIDDSLMIIVSDSGPGITKEKLDQINDMLLNTNKLQTKTINSTNQGIGILNVSRRIIAYYGEKSEMHIECPSEGGTRVFIKISVTI